MPDKMDLRFFRNSVVQRMLLNELQEGHPKIRIWRVLNDSRSSPMASVWQVIIFIAICASFLSMVAMTLIADPRGARSIYGVQMASAVVLLFDWATRAAVHLSFLPAVSCSPAQSQKTTNNIKIKLV